MRMGRVVKRLAALCLALLFSLLLLPMGFSQAEEEAQPLLQVHQMALGIADGYLIRLGDVNILVDGGNANPKAPTDAVVNYLRAAGVDRLDAVIITHWHLDHCMCLNEVLAIFGDVDTIVYSPAERVPDSIFNGSVTVKIGPLVTGEHRQMHMGDVLTFGGMTITCIGPEKLKNAGGSNQDSLNFVLQYGSRRFLFTGDFAQSNCINQQYTELCAYVDVLKFPHHGIEPYEIGQKALRVVRPQYVLVPGVVNEQKIWNFADNMVVKFPKENVLSNADGHVVILTDGGERFEVLTQVDPAAFAPCNTQEQVR